MAGFCEGGNEPPGSLKRVMEDGVRNKNITLQAASEGADSLDRPPWIVAKRRWMTSAMAPEVDLLGGGVSPRTERGPWGMLPKQECSLFKFTGYRTQFFQTRRPHLDAATVMDSLKFTARRTQVLRICRTRLDTATVTDSLKFTARRTQVHLARCCPRLEG
ncbi:hypothetical protein ANN_10477 [Periplaneta americana]|uniref:Uncharacterized protein n=1 Tax=Periplaneta americana TaxID=6978 RepID=A0ABQ8TQQ8_PERAM|nr:hypothetical protein ANN_10477 [Periplaneta americana]